VLLYHDTGAIEIGGKICNLFEKKRKGGVRKDKRSVYIIANKENIGEAGREGHIRASVPVSKKKPEKRH